jgi:hypothetical protein
MAMERDVFRIARGVKFSALPGRFCLCHVQREKHAGKQNASLQMFVFFMDRMGRLICDLEDQTWV